MVVRSFNSDNLSGRKRMKVYMNDREKEKHSFGCRHMVNVKIGIVNSEVGEL